MKTYTRLFLIPWIFVLLPVVVASAQVPLRVDGYGGKQGIFIEYAGGEKPILDTLVADRKGRFRLPVKGMNPGRLYGVVLPDLHYITLDFFYESPRMKMRTESEGPLTGFRVRRSPSTAAQYAERKLSIPVWRELNALVLQGRIDPGETDRLAGLLRIYRTVSLERYAGTRWARTYALDRATGLPYTNVREFAPLMRLRYREGASNRFLTHRPAGDPELLLHPVWENNLRMYLADSLTYPPDAAAQLTALLDEVSGSPEVLHMILRVLAEMLYDTHDLRYESFLIRTWDRYFAPQAEEFGRIPDFIRREALVDLMRQNRNGSEIGDLDVRTLQFEKATMKDLIGGRDYTILVFWDEHILDQKKAIFDWRDKYNNSTAWLDGIGFAFVEIGADQNDWINALHNLNILDHPNYLNWLQNHTVDAYYHPVLAKDFPITYLIDAHGVIVDKLQTDIRKYIHEARPRP